MLIFRLWAELRGYVVLRAEGPTLEKFINIASQRGIRLWQVARVNEDRLYLCTTPAGFRAMRKLALLTRTRLHLVRREGLPFLLLALSRRKALVAGALLFLFSLSYLSSFIWCVRVEGARRISPTEIIHVAEKAGLAVGGRKRHLNLAGVEKKILEEIPGLTWVGVQLQGTVALIKVVEREVATQDKDFPTHVVAAKDGVVVTVVPLQGMALVKPGETVQKGQVLISGLIPLTEEQRRLRHRPPVEWQSIFLGMDERWGYVHAEGVVEARVWYETTARVPLVEEVPHRTGRYVKGIVVRLGKKNLWFGSRQPAFPECQEEAVSRRLYLNRKISLPVEIKMVTRFEVKRVRRYHTADEAETLAVSRAREDLLRLTGGRPLADQQIEIKTEQAEVIARITGETVEPIQEIRPFHPGEPPPPGLVPSVDGSKQP